MEGNEEKYRRNSYRQMKDDNVAGAVLLSGDDSLDAEKRSSEKL